uniref:Portal protein n=1 Tax=viral metagenome TaxID=1070528 RepID=A0A6M3KDQ3_9ZZZZ
MVRVELNMGLMGIIRSAKESLQSIWGDPRKFDASHTVTEPPSLTRDGIPRKLMDRVRKSWNDMERVRNEHFAGVRAFVGPYSVSGAAASMYRTVVPDVEEKRIPLPLIRSFVQTYTHLLTSGTPQCNVETEYEELKSFAEDFKAVLNRHLLEIEIGPAISGAVWSAMFSVGIVKTGLAEGDDSEGFEVDGEFHDIGKPFSQSVSIRNFVVDMQADSPNEISFVGDRYLRPRAWVEAMREKRDGKNPPGAGTGIENTANSAMPPPARASGILEDGERRLYDEVWVWDLYLPKQGVMCQFADGDDRPLDVFKWDGPEGGPYNLLGFGWVDGEVLPAAPVPALRPLHELVNAAARKIERQAARAKEIYVTDRSGGDDAETIKDAADGAVVGVGNPDAVQPKRFGGPDPALMALIPWGMAEFDKQAGNLSMLAGLAPQSETLGQDQLLSQSANAQVNALRGAVIRMVTKVLRQHAWYVWTDPARAYSAEKNVPGTGIRLKVTLGAEVREGDFLDYNFELQPYSMTQTTPAEQVEQLRRFWAQDVMPNVQLLMATGQAVDAAGYIKRIAAMTNVALGDQVLLEQSPDAMSRQQPEMTPEPPQIAGSRGPRAPVARDHNEQFMQAIGAMSQNNRTP